MNKGTENSSPTVTAFTLVELLVVISIIALLMSILLPCLGRSREKARQTVCMANLHSIGLAIHLYSQKNNGRIMPGDHSVPWVVWAVPHDQSNDPNQVKYGPVNLGHLLTQNLLPVPDDIDSVVFCPSSRNPDGTRADEYFVEAWGSGSTEAYVTYMMNISLDGFKHHIKYGSQPVSAHGDIINFLRVNGSVEPFRDRKLVYDPGVGGELIPEVCSRTGQNFPSGMVHSWFSSGRVDLDEAKHYLANPDGWYENCSTDKETNGQLLANLSGNESIVSDLVATIGPDNTPTPPT